ncbi:YveK family protein [Listeria ilorinensis]|uniref:YveK family protein n=1 Tax=Listeria ilorinensis TaxID=2867439 RepID=UPI001EF46F95|nr:Wzz/FepE/Etk N-terminal domain-containing protein [Listeria ilorinensis]
MEEKTMDYKKFLKVISTDKWWLIGIILVVLGIMFLYVQFLAEPVYQKDVQMLVNQSDQTQGTTKESQSVQADLQMVRTYSAIITSPRILHIVQQKLDHAYTEEELAEMIQVNNSTDSQIITINVESSSPQESANIANQTAKTVQEEIPKIMKVNNVTTLSSAEVNQDETPVKPKKSLLMLLGLCIGIVLAMIFAFVRLFLDRTFTSLEEMQNILRINALGEVGQNKQLLFTRTNFQRRRRS